ncbi:MAG: hypothetical protein HFJ36_06975 [Clostridia bacterium]|nr:hypothetical protein [Clostridia bacterium]
MPSISEKVEALIEWMEKYPKATIVPKVSEDVLRQYSKTDREYEQILEEYEKIKEYYQYVRIRKRKNKVDENEIIKCRLGNVGGVFGYPNQIEKLAKQYGISEEKISYIMDKYGTIDNFHKLYRNQELENEKDVILANSFIKNLVDIDCNFNVGYDNLYREIIRRTNNTYNELVLYSSEGIKECIENLSENERTILEKRFCLTSNNNSNTLMNIASEMKITAEGVRKIQERALKRLRIRKKEFTFDINKLINSKFITDNEKMQLLEIEKELKDINFSRVDIARNSVIERLRNLKALQIKEKASIPEDYISIENAKFTTRAYSVLRFQGINYLHEISNYTYKELSNLRNLGAISRQEIIAKLAEHGLQLKEEANIEKKEGQITIKDANLSIRAYKALRSKGINYLQEISNYTYEELISLKSIGVTTMQEIITKLAEHGLQLKEKSDLEEKDTEKQEVVKRILEKQKTISEQQKEISQLSKAKKEL